MTVWMKRILGVLLLTALLLLTACSRQEKDIVTWREDVQPVHSGAQALSVPGKTYYVSPTGDDKQDGLSEKTAFRSIARVNQIELQPGDAVLFQCGGV